MDKFNILYGQLMTKLGKPAERNQYIGMSAKFILEDIDKAAKLVCEDTENESYIKSLFTKINDAVSISLEMFVKVGNGLKENPFIKKLLGKNIEPSIDIEKYCSKLYFDGDPNREFKFMEDGGNKFLVLCCNLDGILLFDHGIDNEVPMQSRKIATEGIFTTILTGGFKMAVAALKVLCFTVFALLAVAAWIIEMISKGVVVTMKWASYLAGLGALYSIGRGDLADDFKKKFDWLHGERKPADADANAEKADGVEIHFMTNGSDKNVVAKDGKTLSNGILQVFKDCISNAMKRFSTDSTVD